MDMVSFRPRAFKSLLQRLFLYTVVADSEITKQPLLLFRGSVDCEPCQFAIIVLQELSSSNFHVVTKPGIEFSLAHSRVIWIDYKSLCSANSYEGCPSVRGPKRKPIIRPTITFIGSCGLDAHGHNAIMILRFYYSSLPFDPGFNSPRC